MPIHLETSFAPLFITTASGVLTDDEYKNYLARCTNEMLALNLPYGFVYDGLGIADMAARQRKMQGEWVKANTPVIERNLAGAGFAFASTFTRGLLTAVNWMAPPKYPQKVFSDRLAAIAWCIARLEDRHVVVPESARTLLKSRVA